MSQINRGRTRTMTVGVLIAAGLGLGLTGCNTEGPEEGTDVEDISEGSIAPSTPAESRNVPAEPRVPYSGAYNQDFYDQADAYVGQDVTLSAEVTRTVSPDAFVIAGAEDTAVDPLLVIEAEEIPALDDGEVVRVTGTVQKDFDPVKVSQDLGIDLDTSKLGDYEGQPYVEATKGEVMEQG